MITVHEGDLFASGAEALVNPVNCVGTMGKGLALAFKKRFPELVPLYEQACRDKRLALGKVWIAERPQGSPRYVVHFPTKHHWRDDSYSWAIAKGLMVLRGEIEARSIQSIAIPALGCGLGGLSWSNVEPMMREELADLNAKVFLYKPGA